MENKIKKAIQETLVISNKQSIHIAVEKIIKLYNKKHSSIIEMFENSIANVSDYIEDNADIELSQKEEHNYYAAMNKKIAWEDALNEIKSILIK